MGILLRVPILVLLLLLPILLSCSFPVRRLGPGPNVEDDAEKRIHHQVKNVCQKVPHRMLRQVLGSAYNEYYMSYETLEGSSLIYRFDPGKISVHRRNSDNGNRTVVLREDMEIVLSDKPAWEVDFSEDFSHILSQGSFAPAPTVNKTGSPQRLKRSPPRNVLDAIGLYGNIHFKWHCDEAPFRWKDLGPDYFPRYILSIDCNHHDCQGPRFRCEPLLYPIKVLRKRDGVCAPGFNVDKDTLQIGSDQMPNSLRDLWVWEMRTISNCCVCQYKW